MANVTKIGTDLQKGEDRVMQVTAAIHNLGPELSGLACFGKCKDGTFVTLTANAMDPATLGYSQCQLSALSAQLSYYMDTTADDIELPEQ